MKSNVHIFDYEGDISWVNAYFGEYRLATTLLKHLESEYQVWTAYLLLFIDIIAMTHSFCLFFNSLRLWYLYTNSIKANSRSCETWYFINCDFLITVSKDQFFVTLTLIWEQSLKTVWGIFLNCQNKKNIRNDRECNTISPN